MKRDNLQILANGLLAADIRGVQFDMSVFDENGDRWNANEITASDCIHLSKMATECGTVGCALGWAPFFGLKKNVGESWQRFGNRSLIDVEIHPEEWRWCFSAAWSRVDNTKRGAAQRIIWLLQYGLPKNHREQMRGEDRLCYTEIEGFCESYLEEHV